jgi:hypothetical protein
MLALSVSPPEYLMNISIIILNIRERMLEEALIRRVSSANCE